MELVPSLAIIITIISIVLVGRACWTQNVQAAMGWFVAALSQIQIVIMSNGG